MSDPRRREKAQFWRDPHITDLELLHASYITLTFAPHTHEGYVIAVIEQGAERFAHRGTIHTAPAGSITLINPGEVHTGEAAHESGWIYRAFYPPATLLQRAASELAGRSRDVPFFPSTIIHDPELARMFVQVHATLEQPASPFEREAGLLWALGHLIVRHADDRPVVAPVRLEPAYVRAVRDYLEHHYADNVTLAQLADVVNLSPFHLLRMFRDAVGLPPHIYLTNVRVRRARCLLARGVPIATVAAQTGFVDQSHLTRHFKRIVGVTPGQYQQMRKNIQDVPQP